MFAHARVNGVTWTHGHYLIFFLPLLLSINGCCLLMHVFLIFRDSNSRTDYFQEEGSDSIHGGIFSFKEVSEVFEEEPKKWDTCCIYISWSKSKMRKIGAT